MSGELVTTNSKTTSELIMAIVSAGDVDIDKVEKLLLMKERYEANEARKAYFDAMSNFKANPPDIEKDKKVAFEAGGKKVSYNHASLANITDKIGVALSKNGLSASWSTKQEGGLISVTCRIAHRLGHSEETTLSAAADISGSKNAIQAIGSAITYLQRYSLLSLTGLATHDTDDDGVAASVPAYTMTDNEAATLSDWIVSAQTTEEKLCKHLGIKTIADITKDLYKKACADLKAKAQKE